MLRCSEWNATVGSSYPRHARGMGTAATARGSRWPPILAYLSTCLLESWVTWCSSRSTIAKTHGSGTSWSSGTTTWDTSRYRSAASLLRPRRLPAARCARLRGCGVGGGSTGHVHRLNTARADPELALGREQCAVPDLALGAVPQPGFDDPGPRRPPAADRLAGDVRVPARPPGDLRRGRSLPGNLLPGGELAPRGPDAGPREARPPSFGRAAGQGHPGLPAVAILPASSRGTPDEGRPSMGAEDLR